MATFTASEWTSQPKHMPSGLQTKTATFTLSTTATASSVFLLVKVPDQAVLTDFQFFIEAAGDNNTWDRGILYPEGSSSTTMTQSALHSAASDSASALIRPNSNKLPYKVSISSECAQRWAWVVAVPSAAASGSAVMRMTVHYTMDGA